MPYYKFLASEARFEETEDGQQGEVTYVDWPENTGGGIVTALPARGTAFNFLGTNASSCLLRTESRAYVERDTTRTRYTLKYSTRKGGGGSGGAMRDKEDRRWSYNGEMSSVSNPDGWRWYNGGSAGTVPIERGDAHIAKRCFLGSFEMSTGELTHAGHVSLISTVRSLAGCINSDTFDGWSRGNVLLEGMDGGTFRNDKGLLRYRYNIKFAVRLPEGKNLDGWQWVLRKDGTWDAPVDPAGGFAYKYGSFNSLPVEQM